MTDVSRETRDLVEYYADVRGLDLYARILATRGVERGLIGPREIPRLWPRHIANCAVVAEESEVIRSGSRVADVGSGAGLPGLVWALVRPDLVVTLIEPLLRRATFLTEAVAELGLGDRVEVVRARAEDVRARDFDVVTARAVARLSQLASWTLPLTRPGGWVVALKGSGASEELAQARGTIARMGGGPAQVQVFGVGRLDPPTTAVLIPRASGGHRRRAVSSAGARVPHDEVTNTLRSHE